MPTTLAQLSIYVSVGVPEITDLSYSNYGLDIDIRNVGDDGGNFILKVNCSDNWKPESRSISVMGYNLDSGETKELRIPLHCSVSSESERISKCYKTISCDVNIYDSMAMPSDDDYSDADSIFFEAVRPSYCNTLYSQCDKNEVRCQGNELVRCNEYCDSYEIIEVCDYKCGWKVGGNRCISLEEESAERMNNSLMTFGVLGLFIAIPVIIFLGWRYMLKKKGVYKQDKYCSKCGHKVKKDSKFCPKCGERV